MAKQMYGGINGRSTIYEFPLKNGNGQGSCAIFRHTQISCQVGSILYICIYYIISIIYIYTLNIYIYIYTYIYILNTLSIYDIYIYIYPMKYPCIIGYLLLEISHFVLWDFSQVRDPSSSLPLR